jgi:hypothetical protein
MAQTKSRSSTRKSSGSQRSSASRSGSRATSARGNSRSGRTSSPSTRNRSGATRARPRQPQTQRNGKGAAQRVQQTVRRRFREAEHSVADATSGAGRTVGNIASKAKGPAVATGAAAAGLAGGLLIASRRPSPKLFGVVSRPQGGGKLESVGNGLLRASENVGRASENVRQLTEEVRRVREGVEADSKRRSPIEVVLEGLTHRARA